MEKGRKPDSSRLNLFYIVHVLQRYSDREHPMSVSKIQEKINQDFGYISMTDSLISADTIKRILDELIERVFPDEMIFYHIAKNQNYSVDETAKEPLLRYFSTRITENDFGNGREARSLLETTVIYAAKRVLEQKKKKYLK